MNHLLLIDDDHNTLASLARAFRSLAGHEATIADSAARAPGTAALLYLRSDLLRCRHARQGRHQASSTRFARSVSLTPVVMMSGQATLDMAVAAPPGSGAFDFLEVKPLSTEKLLVTVENALKVSFRLERENCELRKRAGRHEIVWTSDAMRRVMAQVERVAPGESRVCILGETGTGSGDGRARHPQPEPAVLRPFRDAELRRGSGGTDRERTLRA